MIEIAREHLIPIRDVPGRLPRRPDGETVHLSSVYRWIERGIRGVRLESVRVGGTTYTSAEALQRFADQLGQPGQRLDEPAPVTSRARAQQIEKAAREVESILRTSRRGRQ